MTAQRLDVRFCIVWEGNWHAGSGEGDAAFDRRVRRRATSNLPLMPGSQFKGVIASRVAPTTSLSASVSLTFISSRAF
jgi:CRISPR/Cas system CMR subunit Cmr4 (Cas7 group RAMP superfamily)